MSVEFRGKCEIAKHSFPRLGKVALAERRKGILDGVIVVVIMRLYTAYHSVTLRVPSRYAVIGYSFCLLLDFRRSLLRRLKPANS
jgi:hypothetical protein